MARHAKSPEVIRDVLIIDPPVAHHAWPVEFSLQAGLGRTGRAEPFEDGTNRAAFEWPCSHPLAFEKDIVHSIDWPIFLPARRYHDGWGISGAVGQRTCAGA